ncbi:MAG: hypothetical protein CMJ49_07145 [Planctomycetaceae bacterium]|nr:hypothetical protein [Planctomycetaceae bacterium]
MHPQYDRKINEDEALASNVSVLHRWFPDGSAVLTFQIERKDDDNTYFGHLSKIDTATKRVKPLVAVAGGQDVYFDLSPDGNQVVFSASAAGPLGRELDADSDRTSLYLYDMTTGKLETLINRTVTCAKFSPDGRRLLLGVPDKNDDGPSKIGVMDLKTRKSKTLARDAVLKVGDMMNSVSVYPSWVDDESVIYLSQYAAYGTAAVNVRLQSVTIDGQTQTDLQPIIDAGAGAHAAP